MAPSDKALSYHDVLLRHQDIDLLRGHHWLNDQVRPRASGYRSRPRAKLMRAQRGPAQIIAFWFEYLGKERFSGRAVAYIPGSMAFLLSNCGEAGAVRHERGARCDHCTRRDTPGSACRR